LVQERADFTVGETASLTKTVTEEDIQAFADITGDTNPIHLDDAYARTTRFGGRIAHGMLVAGFISAALGSKLPGPGAIYLGQELRFVAPVRPGDTLTVTVRVEAWDNVKGRITLATEVRNQADAPVVTGSAKLVISSYLKG
jgi:3-hydroxybutyryl-CoA dehydratase